MADVIEVGADGGFDIPATPVVVPTSRTTTQSSTVDPTEPKPRRIRIQLEDDDDDEDGDDYNGDRNFETPPVTAPADVSVGEQEKPRAPASNRPRYQIYKIENPSEDPMLEVVVSLSRESKAAPISTAKATAAKTRDDRAFDVPQAPSCPSVSISSDGRTVGVDPDPAAEAGRVAKDVVDGSRQRFSLRLPHRVVPGTAMSFFSEGNITVRATLAGGE